MILLRNHNLNLKLKKQKDLAINARFEGYFLIKLHYFQPIYIKYFKKLFKLIEFGIEG